MDDVSLQARQSHRLRPGGLHYAMRNPVAAWLASGARSRASAACSVLTCSRTRMIATSEEPLVQRRWRPTRFFAATLAGWTAPGLAATGNQLDRPYTGSRRA